MSAWRPFAGILLAALLAGAVSAWLHPRRPPWYEVESTERQRYSLDLEGARALTRASEVLWIDARTRQAYEQGHLPGALLLNQEEWGDLMFEHQFTLSAAIDQVVVVYCDGSGCTRSADIAQRLRELLGLDPVYVLQGDWRELLDDPREASPSPR